MIDFSLKALMWGGLALVATAAVVGFAHHQRDVGRTEVRNAGMASKVKQQGVVIDVQAAVIDKNQSMDEKAKGAEHESKTQAVAVQAVHDGRSADAYRKLLNTLDRVRADALSEGTTRARLAAEASAAADGLGECSGEYRAVAKERDDLSIQVSGLQAVLPSERTDPRTP